MGETVNVPRAIDPEVVVVGAGPTGLFGAILLARSGISVRIVDKSPTAAKESRAFGIAARSLELFLLVGLADRFLDKGVLATGVELFVDGSKVGGFDLGGTARDHTPYPLLLLVPQNEIEAILVEELSRLGVEVERGVEAVAIEQSGEGVRLKLRADEGDGTITARYLIGADGAHSMVRKALGLSFNGSPYPQTFLLADCKVDWKLADGPFRMFMHGPDFALQVPVHGEDYGRVLALDLAPSSDESMASQGSSAVTLEEVETAFRRATQLDLSLRDARWTSRYRVHHRGVDSYRSGRAFVAGDAAHIHSPAGGQGMNTGLQDVANLAWKLSLVLKRGAPEALLDSYHAERWPVGDKVLRYTDRVFSFVASQKGWVSGLRDLVAPLLGATMARSDTVRSRAFHFVSELGIRYHPHAAVAESRHAKDWTDGPAPGHRAPDATIARKIQIFDLIGGYRFHVLALSRTPLDEAAIASLSGELDRLERASGLDLETHLVAHSFIGRDERLVQAETTTAFEAYGVTVDTPQALYLIRPDGHVAWRSNRLDVAGAGAFLAARFAAPRAA